MRVDIQLTDLQTKWVEKEIKRINASGLEALKVNKREIGRRLFEAARKGEAYSK